MRSLRKQRASFRRATGLAPYAIQIIDGGLNQNKLPIIVVRMAGG
ncbi:hypothetical protein [Caproiciproducens galactitolivorans]|nr:hypothetical protein [Caproiciproducens galactitolivorans]